MRNKNRIVLFLILAALSTTVCRCAFDKGQPVTLNLSDGSTIDCSEFYESNPTWETTFYFYTYDCSIPCPDGSLVPAKAMRLPNIEGKYNGVDIVDLDLATLQEQYCTAPSAEPTASPTATPASSAGNAQTTSAPILTGKITACDYKAGYVNFELANPSSKFDDQQTRIALNDSQTNCSVPNSNTAVLSCTLPAGVRFPINVEVEVGGEEVNDFLFDGSFCGYKDPTGSGSGEGGSEGGSPGSPDVVPTATDFGG